MQKQANAKATTPAAKGGAPATVAPTATAPAATTANAPATPPTATAPAATAAPVWLPQHVAGHAKQAAIVAALAQRGAVLVRLPGKGALANALAGAPAAVVQPAALPGLFAAVQSTWQGANVGYVAGGGASYSACCAAHGTKKAKQNPAFVWALPPATPGAPATLLTATGAPYTAPPQGAPQHHAAHYAAAVQACALAFAPAPQA